MAQDLSATQKADQIAHHFFSKFALIVDNARAPVEPRDSATAKIDKWFNIETPDSEKYKDHLRAYRSISTLSSPPPPFELQVLLTIPELTNNQVLVLHDPPASRVRVDPTPSHILLESWQLEFAPSPAWYSSGTNTSGEVTLSAVYKHGICLYRSLFALLRVLPTWRLYQRLRRRGAGLGPTRNGALGIEMRIGPLSTDTDGSHILGFDTPLSTSSPPPRTSTHTFTPITHPLGVITLSTTYLAAPHFHLDTLESLLSSRFLSLDAGPEFTPTLARTRESTSVTTSASHEHSGSPGSLPMRTSLPRSPPSATAAIAERFVLPAPGVGPSPQRQLPFPTTVSPRSRNIALPAIGGGSPSSSPRAPSVTGNFSTSGGSSRLSQEGASANLSAVSTRARRESGGTGRGSDLPSAPSAPLPLPIRRPSINAVHPFKSSTLSSGSPSFHSPSRLSPLSSGPQRAGQTSSPSSISASRPLQQQPLASPSPIGIGTGGRTASSPVLPLRPSPPGPFLPSSLAEKRGQAPLSAVEPIAAPPRQKRYSSSFGHRYVSAGGAVSDGSAGSGEREGMKEGIRERRDSERSRPASASFLSNNTDDDDISVFVQDIDSRKPLAGFGKEQVAAYDREIGVARLGGLGHQRARTEHTAPQMDRDKTLSPGEGYKRERIASTNSPFVESPVPESAEKAAVVNMSPLAVDERLRQLNEAFRQSLVGFVRNGSRASSDTAGRQGELSREYRHREHRQREKDLLGSDILPPSIGRATTTPGGRVATPPVDRSRNRSGIEIGRRSATTPAVVDTGQGSGSASGSASGSGFGEYMRRRTVSAAGSTASEEVMGRLDL